MLLFPCLSLLTLLIAVAPQCLTNNAIYSLVMHDTIRCTLHPPSTSILTGTGGAGVMKAGALFGCTTSPCCLPNCSTLPCSISVKMFRLFYCGAFIQHPCLQSIHKHITPPTTQQPNHHSTQTHITTPTTQNPCSQPTNHPPMHPPPCRSPSTIHAASFKSVR